MDPGTCEGDAGPKSYDIRVGPNCYRRHRRHIIRTFSQDPQLNEDLGNADESEMRAEEPDVQAVPGEHPIADTTANLKNESPAHRRSKRLRTANVRLRDYVS